MKTTIRIAPASRAAVPLPEAPEMCDGNDDELEIRFSLTALGELAVARGDSRGRGRRFRGFGPCAAVA